MTHVLLKGSPAIDAGSDDLAIDANGVTLAYDQRDHLLRFDSPNVTDTESIVDIGATEAGNPDVLIVNTYDDENDTIDDPSDCLDLSLRQALAVAETTEGDDIIEFDPNHNLYINLDVAEFGPLVINSNVQIIGHEANYESVIDGLGAANIFTFENDVWPNEYGYQVSFSGIELLNTSVAAIDIDIEHAYPQSLSLSNVSILYNSGKAIESHNADVNISNSRIAYNDWDAIFVWDAGLSINQSEIDHNDGYGIRVQDGGLTMTNSNVAFNQGIGVTATESVVNVTSS